MSSGKALLCALLTGCFLGAVYGFLRPTRRRWNTPADLVFVAVMIAAWVYLHFGLLQGQVRFATTAAMGVGAFAWEATAGMLLRPVWAGFWDGISTFFRWLCRPF